MRLGINIAVVIRFRLVLSLLEKRNKDRAKNPVLFTFSFSYILFVFFCFLLHFNYREIEACVFVSLSASIDN